MSLVQSLKQKNLIQPPKWLPDNVMYETQMGSTAYGVDGSTSDVDVYGFCIPPKDMVFPHLTGGIMGFGKQIQRFEQYQQHHIDHPDKKVQYDISIYNIVKYFQLCMDNNPNMIDSLFTPQRCVTACTTVGTMVRDSRRIFLHKGAWHKFKGYAYSQLSKIRQKVNASNPKRHETIQKYGYDVKFAYHLVRLLNEVEQIMVEGDLDIQRNREQLKSIRRGEWTLEKVETYFEEKEKALEELYTKSTLQHSPDEALIKQLLIDCLEQHYGSLKDVVLVQDSSGKLLRDLKEIIQRYDH